MPGVNCHKCGRFVGKDGDLDITWDDYCGAWEMGYPTCGPCLRKPGEPGKPDEPDEPKKKYTRIEYHSDTDEHGRCSFTLFWESEYFPGHPDGEYHKGEKAQGFRADPRNWGFPRPEEAAQNPKKVRKYVLQEANLHTIPEWTDLDGTVRMSREEAQELLEDFRNGKGYSIYRTSTFRIEEFLE